MGGFFVRNFFFYRLGYLIFLMYKMNLRGKQTLYNSIVPTNTPQAGKKSRRNTQLETRRDKMAHRYYFWAVINRKRYDDCLTQLFEEFDLQVETISKELMLRIDLIKELTNSQTTTSQLRKKYPYYNWSVNLAA